MNDAVNIIIKNRQGKVLLQMRDSNPANSPLAWGLWGGGLEDDDADFMAGASREFSEELGINSSVLDFKLLVRRQNDRGEERYLVKYIHPLEWGDFTVREGAGAAYFTPEEIAKLTPVSSNIAWCLANAPQVFK